MFHCNPAGEYIANIEEVIPINMDTEYSKQTLAVNNFGEFGK